MLTLLRNEGWRKGVVGHHGGDLGTKDRSFWGGGRKSGVVWCATWSRRDRMGLHSSWVDARHVVTSRPLSLIRAVDGGLAAARVWSDLSQDQLCSPVRSTCGRAVVA